MSDRRIEIYNYSVAVSPNIVVAVQNSMDEYFTERALELLEYMARNTVCCVAFKEDDGIVSNRFYYKGEYLTAEQLFENFL